MKNEITKRYSHEIMKEYSLDELKLKGSIKLSLGEIVALKALALRKNFGELADKLRSAEVVILSKHKNNQATKKEA